MWLVQHSNLTFNFENDEVFALDFVTQPLM